MKVFRGNSDLLAIFKQRWNQLIEEEPDFKFLDKDIRDLVLQINNDTDFVTIWSCSGHIENREVEPYIAFIAKDDKLAIDFHDRIIDEAIESENSFLCEIQHCIQCCRAMLILPDTSVDEHIYPVWLLKWPITDELTSQYMADLIKSAFSKLKQRMSEAAENIDG